MTGRLSLRPSQAQISAQRLPVSQRHRREISCNTTSMKRGHMKINPRLFSPFNSNVKRDADVGTYAHKKYKFLLETFCF